MRAAGYCLVLALVALLGLACSSSDSKKPAAEITPETPGQIGYIVARGGKLEDVLLDGKARDVVGFDDGSVLMDPALSPDGKRIAFILQEPVKNVPGASGGIDFGADMYVVNRDGSDLKELAHHSVLAEYIRVPSWLDSNHLLFSIRGRSADGTADYRIERLDLRTGQRTRVVANAVDPSVTPGATQMIYVSVETATTREKLFISGIDGSNARDLLPLLPVLTLVGSPVMSPDGTQIAFAAGDLLGSGAAPRTRFAGVHPFFQDVWLINVDGSDLRRVAEVVERTLSLSWSPDGRFIYAMGTDTFRRVEVATGAVTDLDTGSTGAGVFFYEVK
jgi:Tol biopolymer transport system component